MNIEDIESKFNNAGEEFIELAKHYYMSNFGSLSKNEIDLLMFKFYLEKMIAINKNNDGTIDYSKISDYKIAKDLGITPQRVRNLKVKKELVYPQDDFEWKNSLRLLLENEKVIRIENHHIKVNIPDPNLFFAIQDYIEDTGGYVDIQLNSKLLSVPIENFMTLLELIDKNNDCEKITEIIENEYKKINSSTNNKLSEIKMVSEITKNTTDSITNVISWFSPIGTISNAASNIITKIMEVCKR